MSKGPYFTYIVASKNRTLYVGMTGDLLRRVFEHKLKLREGFTARYNCNRLAWFERFVDVSNAIQREKELKGWIRVKKTALIEASNPTWEDPSQDWYPHLRAGYEQPIGKADPSLTPQTMNRLQGPKPLCSG
jgi:putative endonuclease